MSKISDWGLPGGSVVKNPLANAGDEGSSRKWQPAPVCLPGKSHGQRSLAGSMGLQRVGHD